MCCLFLLDRLQISEEFGSLAGASKRINKKVIRGSDMSHACLLVWIIKRVLPNLK